MALHTEGLWHAVVRPIWVNKALRLRSTLYSDFMRRMWGVSVVTLAAVFALAVPPSATGTAIAWCTESDPDCAPVGGGPVQDYNPTPPEWQPEGELIAATGFDAIRDSFQFFNYGQRLGAGNALLGYGPNKFASQLTPESMARMFGPKVACAHYSTDASGKATCVPKPAVAEFLDSMNTYMWGGHCFGVAALNAQLFNGELMRSRLTDSQINSGVRLDDKVQGELAYWWTTQTTSDAANGVYMDPLSVVKELTENLAPGKLPYILTLQFEVEGQQAGHAITPHAVYQRANGDYDIAVYDNNFPLRTRAIHVNAADNSYEYLVGTMPNGPQVFSTGNADNLTIGLVELTNIQGTLPCPVCAGNDQIINFGSATALPDDVTIDIRNLDGSKIEGLKQQPNLNPTSGQLPAFKMPAKTDFRVVVDNSKNTSAIDGSINTFLGDGTVLDAEPIVPAGSVLTMEVRADERKLTLRTSKASAPRYLQAAVERAGDDYNAWFIASGKQVGSANAPFSIIENDGATEYSVGGTKPVRIDVVTQRIRSTRSVPAAHTDSSVLVRPGSTLRIDITDWSGPGGVPTLMLVEADGSTREITMVSGLGPKQDLVVPQPAL